jgi:hypothetical protein
VAVRGQSYQPDEEVVRRDSLFLFFFPMSSNLYLDGGRAVLGLDSRGRLSLRKPSIRKPGRARTPVAPLAKLAGWKLSGAAGSLIL